MVRNQFYKGIKLVKNDNGSEFISNPMQNFYYEHGILYESSDIDTHNNMEGWYLSIDVY